MGRTYLMVTLKFIITAFALRNLVGRTYLKVTLIIIIAFSLCNVVGRTYLKLTLKFIITAFALRNLEGRTYLKVTLIIIIAFALCNLVGRTYLTVTSLARIFDEAERSHETQLNASINEYEGNGDSEKAARIKAVNALVPVY